jgi:hypothetical protein
MVDKLSQGHALPPELTNLSRVKQSNERRESLEARWVERAKV